MGKTLQLVLGEFLLLHVYAPKPILLYYYSKLLLAWDYPGQGPLIQVYYLAV